MDAATPPAPAQWGAATGGVRVLLRLEALTVLVGATSAYFMLDGNPWLFAIAFFAPDLSFSGYVISARVGAMAYNAVHSYVLAGLLGGAGAVLGTELIWSLALILCAHIGFDRSLGYGLKYSAGFGFTHMGAIGKRSPG